LGLEAQRAAVAAHVAAAHGAVTAEFVEVESGRRKDRMSDVAQERAMPKLSETVNFH